MNNEYIIINKSLLEKRIEELEKEYSKKEEINLVFDPTNIDDQWCNIIDGQIISLKHILSQSTPLIPEIERAFIAGKKPYQVNDYGTFGFQNSGHYIENLKLDV